MAACARERVYAGVWFAIYTHVYYFHILVLFRVRVCLLLHNTPHPTTHPRTYARMHDRTHAHTERET